MEIETGKTLVIRLLQIGDAGADGTRVLSFELNGLPREVLIKDNTVQSTVVERKKADKAHPGHVAATLAGTVVKLLVAKGARVTAGAPLGVTDAMKMETTIQAPMDGIVKEIYVKQGDRIETGDLLLEISK